jgi:16S rRNA (guanine(527)-N(7))-methyltransferase RsmG
MLRWNKVINLTRIERLEEVVDRHYSESLFVGANLPPGSLTIADLGSGAGFPGFPISILRPECSVILIESHQRKAVFLNEASRGLPNLSVLSKRAEEVGGRFDWVVSRAVSPGEVLRIARGLAPNVALLCNNTPLEADRVIPLPWAEHRNLIMFHVKL